MSESETPRIEPGSDYVPLARDTFFVRATRLVRALFVGGAATLTDLAVLTLCIRVFRLSPDTARIPALLAGAIVQFLGNRKFTFGAHAGSFARHAWLFLAFETPAYLANLFLFRYLVRWIQFAPPEAVAQVGTFLVFFGYSYPIRRIAIFRLLRSETERRNTQSKTFQLMDGLNAPSRSLEP